MDEILSILGFVLIIIVLIALVDPQRLGRTGAEIVCGFRGDCPCNGDEPAPEPGC